MPAQNCHTALLQLQHVWSQVPIRPHADPLQWRLRKDGPARDPSSPLQDDRQGDKRSALHVQLDQELHQESQPGQREPEPVELQRVDAVD